jgi:hypothetical protein
MTMLHSLEKLVLMSFTFRRTHSVRFSGGTFNNVAGDLNIVNTVAAPGYDISLPQNRELRVAHGGGWFDNLSS